MSTRLHHSSLSRTPPLTSGPASPRSRLSVTPHPVAPRRAPRSRLSVTPHPVARRRACPTTLLCSLARLCHERALPPPTAPPGALPLSRHMSRPASPLPLLHAVAPTGPLPPLLSTMTLFKERRSPLSPLPFCPPFFELEHPTEEPNTPPHSGELIDPVPRRQNPPSAPDFIQAMPRTTSTGESCPEPLHPHMAAPSSPPLLPRGVGHAEPHTVPWSTATASDHRRARPPPPSSCYATVTVSRPLPHVAQRVASTPMVLIPHTEPHLAQW
jgi:hypothetical protein